MKGRSGAVGSGVSYLVRPLTRLRLADSLRRATRALLNRHLVELSNCTRMDRGVTSWCTGCDRAHVDEKRHAAEEGCPEITRKKFCGSA